MCKVMQWFYRVGEKKFERWNWITLPSLPQDQFMSASFSFSFTVYFSLFPFVPSLRYPYSFSTPSSLYFPTQNLLVEVKLISICTPSVKMVTNQRHGICTPARNRPVVWVNCYSAIASDTWCSSLSLLCLRQQVLSLIALPMVKSSSHISEGSIPYRRDFSISSILQIWENRDPESIWSASALVLSLETVCIC